MATSGGNNLMTYHQFLAAEQQQQAAEGGPQIFQSDCCHKFAHLCSLTLIFVASLWGKVCFRCAVGARIWAGEYFRKKKYHPLSLFILIDDVDNTATWLNDLNIEVKYLSNIPQIISLKWNPQIISLIPNPRSGRGSISSAAFPEHHRVSTWALQQFYSSIKVWKWEKDKKGVTQPLVIKFYI